MSYPIGRHPNDAGQFGTPIGEVRQVDADTGAEKGAKLARFDLIPTGPLTELAEHFGAGAKKYADNNWRRRYSWSLSYAALQRHAAAFWGGEDLDPETGSKHIIAVAWHAFALAEFMETNREKDDRWSQEQVEQDQMLMWELPPPVDFIEYEGSDDREPAATEEPAARPIIGGYISVKEAIDREESETWRQWRRDSHILNEISYQAALVLGLAHEPNAVDLDILALHEKMRDEIGALRLRLALSGDPWYRPAGQPDGITDPEDDR
jgi:hypothetical protein